MCNIFNQWIESSSIGSVNLMGSIVSNDSHLNALVAIVALVALFGWLAGACEREEAISRTFCKQFENQLNLLT